MNASVLPGEQPAASLSGKELAATIRAQCAADAAELSASATPPRLVVVVATDDGSSVSYVRSIAKAAEKADIRCDIVDLGAEAPEQLIADTLTTLSDDDTVHGIILQTPLPAGLELQRLAAAIDPAKDVDGANPASLGLLAAGQPAFAPATAEAVIALLDHHGVEVAGKHTVVVGRSTVVGIPLSHLLLARNATVTVCHSRTPVLATHTTRGDVVVVAVGRPGLVTAEDVANGAVVVDVGTNVTDSGKLVGDVDADKVALKAGALTPVPGGVGPVTTALLLRHTITAAQATRVRVAG